jgi:nucleotide-binding universal stress UspA family protein
MEPVVVGTDGSPSAGQAVLWAAADAARRQRPLLIVHAQPRYQSAFHPAWNEPGRDGGAQQILADAAALAAEICGSDVTTEHFKESAAYELRRQADHAFEVVVGHRGHEGFVGLLLGSTALKIVGHAQSPVVVVRGSAIEPPKGTVLLGIDGNDVSEAALAYACGAAEVRNAQLRVVDVCAVPSNLLTGKYQGYQSLIQRALADSADLLRKAVAPWRETCPDLEIIGEAVPGHPVETLAGLSAEADLLVVGSRGRTAVHRAMLGSVSHGVLHHARCPIAVVSQIRDAAASA